MEIILQLVLLCVGFALLSKGADWFVDGAAGIAARFGISQLVIGLTIVAMGTSAPEAAVSIAASYSGSAGITVGNIVGSNIMNILVILGLTAVIKALPVEKGTIRIELPFVIAITVLLYILGLDGTLSFLDGLILFGCFIGYLTYLYFCAMQNLEIVEDDVCGNSLWHDISYTVFGMGVIMFGSNVTVDAAVAIAKFLGWSDRIIGLTIVALGTSLPEMFTSVTAARRGNVDIAIGNIVGSNIFNILFVIGLSSILIPIPFAKEFMHDMYWCIAAAIALLVLVLPTRRLERWGGAMMLIMYSVYLYLML